MANIRLKNKAEIGRDLNDNDLIFVSKTNEDTDNPSTFSRIKTQLTNVIVSVTDLLYSSISHLHPQYSLSADTGLLQHQVVTKANLSGATFTGTVNAIDLYSINISAGTVSSTTFMSGGTDIFNVFKDYVDDRFVSNNTLVVSKTPKEGEFLTIESALSSITNNSSANTYSIVVGNGKFIENTLVMKPYVYVLGTNMFSTIIETSAPGQHVIVGSNNSSINYITIQGAVGTGYCSIYHSPSNGTVNDFFFVNSVKFGTSDTLVHCYGNTHPAFVFLRSCNFGGGAQFNKGFIANNASSVNSKITLQGCSTIGGLISPYPTEFATADGVNAEIAVNSLQVRTETGGLSSGTCFLFKNGGLGRLLSVNIKGFTRGIATDTGGAAPRIISNGIIIESCTKEIDILHENTTGFITGAYDISKTFINETSSFYITGKDKYLVTVGKSGSDFSSIESALDFIVDNSESKRFVIKVEPGIYYENELFMKPYVNIMGENIYSVVVSPIGNHNLFTFTGTSSEISFFSISGASSGYAGIYVNDAGNFTQCHKVSFLDCDTGIKVVSRTKDTYMYAEFIDFNGTYINGIYVEDETNSHVAFCNAENCYNTPTAASYFNKSVGTNALIEIMTSGNLGSGVEHAFCSLSGGSVEVSGSYVEDCMYGFHNSYGGNIYCNGVIIENCAKGIYSEGTIGSINISANAIINDCTEDIRIDNANTSGSFIGTASHDKIFINENSSFCIVNKDEKIITVAKKGADHTSIKTAYDSVSGASDLNRYLIKVGPGTFVEDEIIMRPYIDVEGAGRFTTIISASSPSNHVFTLCDNSSLHKIRVEGSFSASALYASSIYNTSTDYSYINAVTFGENKILLECYANNYPTIVLVNDIEIGRRHFDQAFKITNNPTYSAESAVRIFNAKMPTGAVSAYPSNIVYGGGVGTELTTTACRFSTGGQALGNIGFYFYDGINVRINSTTLAGFQTGITIDNIGAGTDIRTLALALEKNTMDINVQNPNTIGSIFGGAELSKIYVNPNSTVGLQINEVSDLTIGTVTVGDIYQGNRIDREVNLSTLSIDNATMGLSSGGEISIVSGRTISISAGHGYLTTSSDYVKLISWDTTELTVVSGASRYIEVNENGVISANASKGDEIHSITLGSVYTRTNFIHYLEDTPTNMINLGNRTIKFINNTFGVVYESGSLVSESGTRELSVTSGKRYYALNEYTSSGGTPIVFEEHWRLGDGTYRHGATTATTVQNDVYDYGSGLTSVTTSYYTKHSLYITGAGGEAEYLFMFSQNEYSGLTAAQEAGLPVPPTEFVDSTCIIASIITQQGTASIIEIRDERPVVGGNASTISSTLLHGNLQGLLNDDHPQYLPSNGSRGMESALNMGTYNIISAGTINGITFESHTSRHLPNGLDPLVTAAPLTNIGSSSFNYVGTANSFARSDHQHAINTASTSTDGILLQGDWYIFNNKISVGDNIRTSRIYPNSSNILIDGDVTFTGETTMAAVSASTIISGTTNLYNIFQQIGAPSSLTVIGGLNTYTAGTATNVSVNISSATLNTLTVTGNTSLQATTTTNETVNGTLTVTGNTSLQALTATSEIINGNSTLNGTLTVTGITSLQATTTTNETVNGTLTVTGNTSLKSLTATGATINGNSALNGTLTVTGNTSLQATTTTNETVNGTLTVTGNTSLQATTTTNETVNGTLTVTGNTSLQNTFVNGLTLSAGTTSLAPIVLTSGTSLSVTKAGAVEYDGTHFMYTGNLLIRQSLTPAAFGGMYEDNAGATTITLTTAGNTYGWVSATQQSNYLTTFNNSTAASSGDSIVISTGGDGDWEILINGSIALGNANQTYRCVLYKNQLIQSAFGARARVQNTGNWQSIAIGGIMTGVTAGDMFDVRFIGSQNGNTVSVYNMNFSMKRINR